MNNSTFSPLTSFSIKIADIANIAFMLSLPDAPDFLGARDDLYQDACNTLNALRHNGDIDDIFFDYLCMHLEYCYGQEIH